MSLLDDNLIETAFDEKQMRADYLKHWIERHSSDPETKGVFRNSSRIMNRSKYSGGVQTFDMVCLLDKTGPYRKNMEELNGYYQGVDGVEPLTRLNTSTIINIKPDPSYALIISNISDSDLSEFELRTRNKKGGTLYCINCTQNIARKSRKWRYIFIEYDPQEKGYNIINRI